VNSSNQYVWVVGDIWEIDPPWWWWWWWGGNVGGVTLSNCENVGTGSLSRYSTFFPTSVETLWANVCQIKNNINNLYDCLAQFSFSWRFLEIGWLNLFDYWEWLNFTGGLMQGTQTGITFKDTSSSIFALWNENTYFMITTNKPILQFWIKEFPLNSDWLKYKLIDCNIDLNKSLNSATFESNKNYYITESIANVMELCFKIQPKNWIANVKYNITPYVYTEEIWYKNRNICEGSNWFYYVDYEKTSCNIWDEECVNDYIYNTPGLTKPEDGTEGYTPIWNTINWNNTGISWNCSKFWSDEWEIRSSSWRWYTFEWVGWLIRNLSLYVSCPMEKITDFSNKIIEFKDNFKGFFTLESKTFWP
jgi:hypothetical protein